MYPSAVRQDKPVSACLERCDARNCSACGQKFGFFTRRHHCRSHEHSASYCSWCGGVPMMIGEIHHLCEGQYNCMCTIRMYSSCSAICGRCSVGKDDERFCSKCDEERILKRVAFVKAIDAGVFSQGFVGGGMTRQSISSGSRRRLQEESGHLQRSYSHHEICIVCDKTTCGGNCLRQLTSVTSCQICRQPVEQCETNGMCQQFMEADEKCAYCAVVGCSEGCPRVAFQTDHFDVSDYLQYFAGGAAADSHPRQSFQKGQHSARGGLSIMDDPDNYRNYGESGKVTRKDE